MRFTVSCLTLVAVFASVSHAWVPSTSLKSSSTKNNANNVQFQLHSTVEDTTTTSSTTSVLNAEYAAALEQTTAKISSSIPDENMKNKMMPLLTSFATEYFKAHQHAYEAGRYPDQANAVSTMKRFLTAVGYGLKYGLPKSPDYYTFDVTHKALRGNEPENKDNIDFYDFGCEFFHYCMDLTSPEKNCLGLDNLKKAAEQLANGENVIFFANHQSEADPQVASMCMDIAGYKHVAENSYFVAGHKVTTDPLAVPFSMGYNLICIHSKKHINADPETKPAKQRQNLKAMNSVLKSLKQGGTTIWVAPSGGRDRRDVETGDVPLAPFDSKTIDMFRLLGNKCNVPTHYYTMAMVSYDLCPPPDHVEAGVGEARNFNFEPVGIYIGDELESVGGLELRQTFCKNAMTQCEADYEKLLEVLDKK